MKEGPIRREKCHWVGGGGRLTESGARAAHPKRVLFVRKANVCCSPAAEEILSAHAKDGVSPYRRPAWGSWHSKVRT